MSKEASRIRRIVSSLRSREDLAEIVKMAQGEVVRALAFKELPRYDRAVAIYEAASEALADARTRGQLPRYTQAA